MSAEGIIEKEQVDSILKLGRLQRIGAIETFVLQHDTLKLGLLESRLDDYGAEELNRYCLTPEADPQFKRLWEEHCKDCAGMGLTPYIGDGQRQVVVVPSSSAPLHRNYPEARKWRERIMRR